MRWKDREEIRSKEMQRRYMICTDSPKKEQKGQEEKRRAEKRIGKRIEKKKRIERKENS